jgi:outer membrane protein insertion porin family
VTVPVAEGEEFHFGKVRFAGNTKLPERELGRLVKLEEDQLANFALVNKAVADIEARYKRDGYVHVKATAERALVQKAKAVELVIRIQEGDRYTFRNLEIKGIDINAAAAVRKRWAIQRGQPFDDSYPGTFLKRIEEEAMFDRLAKTAFHVTVDEESKMVDVQLEFVGETAKRKVVR